MVARKRNRAPKKSLKTKLKQDPIGTSKSQWKRLGPWGQIAVLGVGAGALSVSVASKLNRLPVVGQVFSIFTGIGVNLKRKYGN